MAESGGVRLGVWWSGPLAVAAAVGAVLLVQWLALGLLPAPPPFLHDYVEPAVVTAVLVTVAVVVSAIVRHEAQDPIRAFGRIAFVALLVSLLPDVAVGFGSSGTKAGRWRAYSSLSTWPPMWSPSAWCPG